MIQSTREVMKLQELCIVDFPNVEVGKSSWSLAKGNTLIKRFDRQNFRLNCNLGGEIPLVSGMVDDLGLFH